MNEIPDFQSDQLMKHIITINSQRDEYLSEDFKEELIIRECIGKGGSSTVYRAYLPYVDREVAIKLCEPSFMMETCRTFKTEVANTYEFLLLNEKRRCYNYPITYGYYHTCLFFNENEAREMIVYIEKNVPKGKDKNTFMLYCTTPSHIQLPQELVEKAISQFDEEFLLEGVKHLPKSKNAIALLECIGSVYEYIKDEVENLTCSIFVMQQYLKGNVLHGKMDNAVFFEYMYSNLIPIDEFGKVYGDFHADNVMIVPCNVARIYHYKDTYYVIPGDMVYRIDAAVLKDVDRKRVGKYLFNGLVSFFTEEQKEWLDEVFSNGNKNVSVVLDKLMDWLATRVDIFDEDTVKVFMVRNRNYKLIEV